MQLLTKILPKKKSRDFEKLKQRWTKKQETLQSDLWNRHQDALQWWHNNFSPRHLTAGAMGGLMLLTAPATVSLTMPHAASAQTNPVEPIDKNILESAALIKKVPSEVRPLTPAEEQDITSMLTKDYGISITSEVNGLRLNTSYGYIGKEQHLARFPGDTIETHFDSPDEAQMFARSGMAPGLGAWGYFARSKADMTEEDNLREKYYIAVQTFLAPDYNQRVGEYRDFFKYRKMIVINPYNGRAVVADIGDAGPAQWTGKQLGGSPEVMSYLEREDGARRGPVLYFFINDPDNSVPLGPISVK